VRKFRIENAPRRPRLAARSLHEQGHCRLLAQRRKSAKLVLEVCEDRIGARNGVGNQSSASAARGVVKVTGKSIATQRIVLAKEIRPLHGKIVVAVSAKMKVRDASAGGGITRKPLRIATTDDIARAIAYLASDDVAFLTGTNLFATGGQVMPGS
jgi:hypothetical protein